MHICILNILILYSTLHLYKKVSSNIYQPARLFPFCIFFCFVLKLYCLFPPFLIEVPIGSPSRGGDIMVYVWHKPTELAHSLLFCSCVYFCLNGPFNCISFRKFSWQLSVFSLCSSGLSSALMVLSTVYLFMKVSFSPDIITSDWQGSKHQLTN